MIKIDELDRDVIAITTSIEVRLRYYVNIFQKYYQIQIFYISSK